jgi:hypothetical protein
MNTFLTDLATRYNDFQQLLDPHLSTFHNKRLIISLFKQLRIVKNAALEVCKQKKQSN